jgi:8-oxo-dGTP diphosphatase
MANSEGQGPTLWVVAVALVNKAGQTLVQRRAEGSAHAGLWEFPGGKIEPGESPQGAAVRELREELGVTIAAQNLHPVGFACGVTQGPVASRPLVILLFTSTSWEGTPEPHVAADLTWCDPRQLATMAMPPLDYPLAEALTRILHRTAPLP